MRKTIWIIPVISLILSFALNSSILLFIFIVSTIAIILCDAISVKTKIPKSSDRKSWETKSPPTEELYTDRKTEARTVAKKTGKKTTAKPQKIKPITIIGAETSGIELVKCPECGTYNAISYFTLELPVLCEKCESILKDETDISTSYGDSIKEESRQTESDLFESQVSDEDTSISDYSDNWEKISKQIKKRDGYKCQAYAYNLLFGSPNCSYQGYRGDPNLKAHHLLPKSKGGTDDPENLITVCLDCHEEIHGHLKNEIQIGSFKKEGLSRKEAVIQKAIEQDKDIWMKYYTYYRNSMTQRTVSPQILYRGYNSRMYMKAYCHLRKGNRTFRVARIRELKLLD